MFDTLVRRMGEFAASMPDKPVLVFKKDTLTYKELFESALRIGAAIKAEGVKRGDRVLYTSLSKPESIALYLGIHYAGAVAVFLDKNATAENMYDIYQDTEATLMITDKPMKEYAEKCHILSLKALYTASRDEEAPLPDFASTYTLPDPEEYSEMIFTTGTTGRPKGVVLSFRAVFHILSHTRDGVGILPEDRVLVPLPLNHSLAMRVTRAALYTGAAVILQNGFAFAKDLEANILERGATGMVTVPASFSLVHGQMQDKFGEILGKLRFIEVGAGSLTVRQRLDYTALLPDVRITNTWGSSETGGALFTEVHKVAKDPHKITTIGKPLPTIKVKVLDSEGKEIIGSTQENPGRLALEGEMIMSGYWHREPETKDALQNGMLVTNDLVYTDDEGYVYMLGRVDDIINVGGEKVSPIEVENIACQYEAIRECACIGAADPKEVLGQVPVLFLAVEDGYTEEGLKNYLAGKMERYKMPQEYVLVDALPRNRMEKIDRKAMRAMWNERMSSQS